MKKPSFKRPKSLKKASLIVGVVVIGTVAGVAALNSPESSDASTSPIRAQVDEHEEKLDNHEARITNTENDVSDLQANTNTAPSIVRVEVPVVTLPPAPAPEPSPVTVVSAQKTTPGGLQSCKLTYSDGSVEHRNAASFAPGECDENTVGKPKN